MVISAKEFLFVSSLRFAATDHANFAVKRGILPSARANRPPRVWFVGTEPPALLHLESSLVKRASIQRGRKISFTANPTVEQQDLRFFFWCVQLAGAERKSPKGEAFT